MTNLDKVVLGRRALLSATVLGAGVVGGLTACAPSQRGTTGGSGDSGGGSPFVFAASSDPVMLDPAFASDGETFRIARQQFEGLVGTKSGTVELEPLLATKWESSADGKDHTFTLRENVKFSDGTDFNAEAVQFNFERWFNWTGLNQNENISNYYFTIFRGYKTGPLAAKALYKGCTVTSPTEITVHLNAPFASLVDAMTLPAFSMQSPTALQKYNADNTGGTVDDPRFSEYATEHPVGTGPFVFESWDRDQQVKLKRNDNYWGDKSILAEAIVRTISDGKARNQELQAGTIDGYDLVAPGDIKGLQDKGYQIEHRPAFNILYLGMNQANKALQDVRVRQAIAYAIDKDAVVKQSLPDGSKPAIEFMPDMVNGYNPDVEQYAFNVDKAKQLLAAAGYTAAKPLTVQFAYPTGVSRPYMPSPEDTFAALKAQLEAAGIKITPVAAKWSPDYLDLVQNPASASKHDLHLLGWTGDYNDPDNFIGVMFGQQKAEWGFNNPALFKALDDARSLPTLDAKKSAYSKIAVTIADFVPGVPLAHPAPSLAFAKGVQGFVASPVQDEVWNKVTVAR